MRKISHQVLVIPAFAEMTSTFANITYNNTTLVILQSSFLFDMIILLMYRYRPYLKIALLAQCRRYAQILILEILLCIPAVKIFACLDIEPKV